MLYSFSLRLRVRREIPNCSAANVLCPPVRSSALMIICSSMLSRFPTGTDAVWRRAEGSPVSAAVRLGTSISAEVDSTAILPTRFLNSRIFPVQVWESRAWMAWLENVL